MKSTLNYFIDLFMLVAIFACGLIGILKMPELGIDIELNTYATLSIIHDWAGLVGILLVVAHFVLHANWFAVMTKKMIPIRSKGIASLLILVVALLVAQSNTGLSAHGRGVSNATVPQRISYASVSLKDGTYTGTANGYQPSLTVEVTVKSGKIFSVKVTKHNETPRWYYAVADLIPSKIIQAQSTNIDAVSGATCSSYGIMAAVENALAKARK